jgi:acetyl esterase/lipase
MKGKVFRRILKGLLIFIVLFVLYLLTPRLWSALNPSRPPLGYHFVIPGYIAIGTHLEKLVDLHPPVPDGIEEIKNIEYKNVDGKSLQLDIYKPENLTDPVPLIIFVHGGAWRSGNRDDYRVYTVAFAQKGYVTATVSYRLLNNKPYPACVEDVWDAVQWFFRNSEKYGYDKTRIAIVGGSAGAHLALLAAYGWRKEIDSAAVTEYNYRVKAVVDIYGPVDFTTEYAKHQPLVNDFLAHSYRDSPELYTEASPVQYLRKNNPPTLILHGTSDRLVPISQSDTLKARLDRLGVPCVYYRVPLWPHTMDIVKRVNDFCQVKMNDFFKKYL